MTINKPYRVHIGYTRKGNDRWKYFDSLAEADRLLIGPVFQATKIMLSVTANPKFPPCCKEWAYGLCQIRNIGDGCRSQSAVGSYRRGDDGEFYKVSN